MRLRKILWLLMVVAMHLLACGAHNSGPGPGIFPRRRSSNDGVMQSRAVDTRVQFEILEGEPRSTIVGYIPTKPGFTYRFNEPPREFTLDSVTGEIKTNAILDREAISNDRYDLVILSSQPTYPIEVRIIVQDINDNAPEFPEPSIAVSFSESAAQGTRLLLDAATDRDSGTNKVTDDYRIVDGNHDDKFRLAVTTNPSGDVSYLHLETTGKLDRETRGSYVLNISARDGGSPPKNGYLQVNVTILDVNDNPPIFDHSDYIVSLNESVVPGTPVLQVMASDNDLGDNSKITYYLSDTETQFTVDPETGVITTTELLTCPQQNCPTFTTKPGSCPKSCVFTVFARDHGSPRQDGRTYVTVNLVDTNDHAPQIRFQYFPPTGTYATVDENAANGSVVAAVSVEDMDEGLNGETSLRIISGNDLGHFRLDKTPSFDIVRVNGVLDREEIGKYNLTVVASDKGTPSRTATAYLIIHVNDVNDHEPVFEKSEYSAILSELAPPGTFVASITATDEDTGVNAQIYYDFVSPGNNKQWFAIDAVSGLITTRAPLDREVQGSVELSISARDGGPNPKWAHTHLKVTILDENDERPQFSQPHINISLSESTQPHTLVAMLTAADHDQGTNGSVSYALHASVEQSYPNMFALDALTGQLTIRSKLDRETISDYAIRVIARDQGVPQQSSTATVFLHVDDINDNSPDFYPKRYFVAISEDTAIGSSIVRVHATDRDEGDNAIITYKLESGGDGLFVVDNWTGVVSLRSSLRSSQKSLFKLTVSAKDRGDRRTEKDALVEIVRESKLEELEFDAPGHYEFSIYEDFGSENTKIGREVGKTRVTSSSGSIEYAIVYGDPHGNFKIDEQTGVITTARPIDREEAMAYTLTVVARAELAYGNVSVNVNVLDLNDNAPTFVRDTDEIAIPENAAVGQEIYLARARDKDAGINSRVTYSLTYNPQEQFRISESSGVLYLNRPIRVDPGTVMHLEITAMDSGEPHLMSKNSVTITITDVNDHTCVFDHTSYETSLLESTRVNTRFFALSASDADLGANGRISYRIVDGNAESKFGIFPDGYLFVKSRLDREERDYYSLTIGCSDGGNPPRSTEVPVVIHVIDENDNAPQFTNATFTFNIAENEPVDSFVGKLTATDRDIGRNAELIFMLSSVQNDFVVDPRNGFIKTLREFDREALVQQTGQNFIALEATVTDNGAVRLRDKVKVKIFINDVNDHAPQFLRAPYKVQVSEGSTIGSQLIRVYTFDADEGLNGDVFYRIAEGNEGGRFAIDESTGQVTLVKALDRETNSLYRLTVLAHDAAKSARLSSSTSLTIEVLDENDCSPEFVQTDTSVSVSETTPVGTELIRFRATDSDLGVNSQLTYSIAAGNRRDTFHIDPIAGSLYLHKLLDYEDTQTYSLNITASDGGNPRLATTIMFVVNVFDYNDNAPTFPNTAIVRQIREGIPVNTPIVTITAEDPDSGANGKVTYAIQSQEPSFGQRHFGINATSGVIFTMRQIDRESVDTFRLIVVATDQAEVPTQRLSAEKLVTVIVEDINDCEPIFVSMNAAVLPLKDIRVEPGRDGSPIMNVFARDADSSSNGLVTYEMVSGNAELFRLHRSSGVISLRKTIANPEARYQLAVKATDEAVQSERKSSDAYITIISSSSGGAGGPVFEQKDLAGSVFENEPAGTSILTVSAHVSAGQDIEYYVTNVTGNGKQVDRLFDIDTKLGILSTAIELDRENGIETYVIEVYAIVIGGTPRTSSTKVKVTVLDKNDESPTFRDLPSSYMISEDLGNGQTIATIKATDPDTIGKLEYSLISGDDGKFALDKHEGVLKLRDTLDRETKDLYKLVIRVTDSVQYTETTITIQVTDSNDNPPVFSEPAYSFDIPENAPRGYQVGLISATDADLGANSMLTYTVISDWANDVFSLNPQTGVFTLTARLDYEEVQHYILVVQAQDNGHPSLSSTLTVYCNVIDLNDNAPVFDPMSYSNEIYENVPIGTEVVTVSATDIDSGDNGRIEYSITAGNDDDFEIVSNGTIYTRRMLDRETKSTYNLVVTARDCAKDADKRLSSTVQVTIILKDVNDVRPVFITPNETSVSENIPVNTVMMAIKAIDRDEGRNGYVEYMLESNASAAAVPFTLGSVDGLLRVSGRLDRETKANYELTVTARDRGEPPKSTQAKIHVKVLDENDNSPVFDPKHYSASIAENASIGASVLQVSATDIDEGANGRVRFSIASGDDNRDFSISEDTGVVRVAKNLNYERKSRYVLTVRAEDCASDVGSGETRFDTAELIITITDINDCFPTFLDSPYLAYVMENVIPNGGYVITVKAYDADTPPFNNQVRYFLKEGDADLFRINASTGEISLLRALDREQQAEYTLTLVAMDTGSPPLTGTGTVRVIVQDMNDHSPEFERQSYRATVSENLPAGTKVLTPLAHDKDAGLNARIRFSLLGDKVERFAINRETGEITTAAVLDREDAAVYHFTLMAQDSSATDPRAAAVNFTVTVEDVNDNTPAFEQAAFTVNIPDRIKTGQFVFGARAIDLDAGANSRIVYSIGGKDASKFNINPGTGVIKAAEELSLIGHSNDRIFNVDINAVDQGHEPRSAKCELSIDLRPAHLFPTFSYLSETQFILAEDVPEGKLVTKVQASSPKKGSAGAIKYAIAGGNIRDALKIDRTSGDVTVGAGRLDYETSQQYEVWIEASDSDNPSLRSVMKLTINVTDANDNGPLMEKTIYYAEVMEEEPPPQMVARVRATDADSDENGQVSYRLVNDFESAFEIDSDTGEIFTNLRLDREDIASYELTVEAVDQGMPQMTGSATVLITVLDKNDNPPRFTRLFSVNVTENAEIGAFVIKVTSSDLDINENANATYNFTENPGSKFAIDPISGNVTVSGRLDREQQDEYLLKVVAVDGAWRQETPLTITIQDLNDNAPEFEHSYYSFNLPELQKSVAFVGQVTATDRDKQGPNSVISYSLQQPSDLFTIDPATGEIFSKRTIHYKHSQLESSPENMYAMTVLATDNGKPPMYSECLVNINIVDANNNAPKFERRDYLSPAPEHAKEGQRVVQVIARDTLDFGVNAEIDYAITGGNGSNNFVINKNDGWISVSKPLNVGASAVYQLAIRAVDKGVPPQYDDVTVTIVVAGENRFSPVFTALSYQVIVPENEPIGSTILVVSASDNDDGPNGMIRYTISGGNERKEFAVDALSGSVTILQPLDYDIVQEYHLNITARDLGFKARSAVAMLRVTLTDINDQRPEFNQSEYHAYIAENSPAKSFVYRAHATDKDSPKNAIVQYTISGGAGKDFFTVDPHTGVVYSKVTFDYEEQNNYEIVLTASNPDSSNMFNSARLFVHITGVNEFYPRFVQPVFHFDVSESAEVGTSIGSIQATDKDSGDDGRVYYLLVGSSNDKGFSINAETGVVYVSRNLDRETQSRVVLTVMAKNFGGIRGNDTDEAQVIISIQDGNDPPEFQAPLYEATVSEGASVGAKVALVKAIDKDVRPQNNQFSYSIIGGNVDQSFKVDPQSGQVETARKLDREKTPAYSLIVGAIDTGAPPQTGTTLVKIQLADINDNGPTFDADSLVGSVAENEPAGTSVMTLAAKDPDLPPNGAPFTYFLIGGKHKALVTVEKHSGVMKTTRAIDREITPQLEVIIEVEDNGKPRMRSQHTVTVNVLDQNDSPSLPRVAHVMVYTYNGKLQIGKIADVHPNDPDASGDYKCKLISAVKGGALSIPNACDLHTTASIKYTGYSLSVSGNDGVHPDVISTVSVDFLNFDNVTVANSISVRVENMTAANFLANFYRSFQDVVKASMEAGDEVAVYSIREHRGGVEVTIASRFSAGYSYRAPSYLAERVQKKREAFVQLLQNRAIVMPYSPCDANNTTCDNGGICSERISVNEEKVRIIDSQNLIFTSPAVTHDFSCKCADGYTGEKCDKRQDPCAPNPCQAGGQCRRQGYDFQCTCPANREGKLCQLERGDACSSNPCKNGGSCRESPDGSSFFCLCRPGYRGNQCETIADSCRPNPCLYGGLCVSLKPGYKCSCTDGRYGRHCERATYGFQELSFMQFPALDAATNDISIVFATTKPDALLIYNYGVQSGGRSDFVAMEIVGGRAVFSYGGARTAVTSIVVGGGSSSSNSKDATESLSNGRWHKVTATRNGRVMSLSVSKCTDNGDVCEECRPGDTTCYSDEVGPTGTLNFNKHPLLIGGLSSADPILERPGQIHSDDLIGCVHSVSVNGRALNLSSPLKAAGVSATCNRNNNGGPCSQGHPDDPALSLCGAFDGCMDRWHTAMCKCGGNLLSPDCYTSIDPISLVDGGFIEYKISEKHKRMQLLESIYGGGGGVPLWNVDLGRTKRFSIRTENVSSSLAALVDDPPKSMSLKFRTVKADGLLIYAATNKHFTSVELRDGRLLYVSKQNTQVNMTSTRGGAYLADGKWHNLTLFSHNRVMQVLIDGALYGDELDSTGVHDFLDPYLTVLSVGGVRRELVFPPDATVASFEGCVANFTINNEIQPFNGSGSIYKEVLQRGKVFLGCHPLTGLASVQVTDPLSIGITLVIVFFVILLIAILASFVVFRIRKQQKEKHGAGALHSKQNGTSTLLGGSGLVSGSGNLDMGRGMHVNDLAGVGFHSDASHHGTHHLVAAELISKKYKEREINSSEPQRPQRPDIIEREVVSKSPPPLREVMSNHAHDHLANIDNGSEFPEHYDLENASSIAPSDIDIVYHYKGYREAGGVRHQKYKATPPPNSYTHHKHQSSAAAQHHRHSPHHGGPYAPRVPPQTSQPPTATPRPPHQSTPLARLSPSSEMSSQHPRILTLHDISGKPLQSALLATTSSSGGVGKDVLHSNSERSLNSPVMSQLSGQSSNTSRKTPGMPPPKTPNVSSVPMGLTAEEIERLNARPRTSSLVSTLDAVSSSSEAPRVPGQHMNHMHHSPVVDNHSSTSSDESGNDSFTCSEIEYDNNSINGDIRPKREDERNGNESGNASTSSKPPAHIPPPSYDGFDSSFRGSLSTLVASDDDISTHMGGMYRQPNGAASPSATTLGWDYLLNWGPNFESLMGVFKDIAELPDTVGGTRSISNSLRIPASVQNPSEEYV